MLFPQVLLKPLSTTSLSMNETRMLSGQEERSSHRNFAALLPALSRPGAYP
jgi:hypothetical protein